MKPPTPLLLIPGLLCDEEVWAAQAAALGRGREVIVGPCGIGDTVDSLQAMARHLLAATPAPQLAVAGHSMGGRIALELLRLAPTRVRGLALLDSGVTARPSGAAGEEETRSRQALVELAATQGLLAVARTWLTPMVHPEVIGTVLYERMLSMVLRSNPLRFAAQVRSLLHRPDAQPVLRSARCPVLLVCGEQDRWSPPERHVAMQALLPQAQLKLIADCGHMSPMEQPTAVSAALAGWLAQCDEQV